jgi:hypothetical protein
MQTIDAIIFETKGSREKLSMPRAINLKLFNPLSLGMRSHNQKTIRGQTKTH